MLLSKRRTLPALYILLLTHFFACAQPKTYNGETFDEIEPNSSTNPDLFIATKGGKRGFIDANNRKITGIIYDEVYPFKGDWALVCLDKKYGFIDRQGKVVVPIEYDYADKYYSPTMALLRKGPQGAFYRKGKGFITDFKYDRSSFGQNDAYYKMFQNGKGGLIDSLGHEILKAKWDEVMAVNFPQKAFLVKENNQWTIIDTNGKPLLKNRYEELYPPNSSGLCVARKNGMYGAIDREEKTVIPFEYEQLDLSGRELFVAKKGEKYGYIDRNNKVVIPFNYEDVRNLENGLAEVSTTPVLHTLINPTNEMILPANGRFIQRLDSSVILVMAYSETRQGHNEYLIYKDNKVQYRTHNEVTYISSFKDRMLFVEHGENRVTIINAEGKEVIPGTFSFVMGSNLPGIYMSFKNDDNGMVGIYDLKAQKVKLEPQFTHAEVWGNKCVVKKDKGYYVVALD